jgi:predicted  nucleic acid-binding Zn-ribbon protein
MHSDLAKIISETKFKIDALKDKLEALYKENQILKNRLTAAEDQNKLMNEEVDEKNNDIKMLKLARKVAGGNTDTQGVKRQINELVNEIDRCMALLNG